MIELLLTLALIGVLVYCLVTYLPMPPIFKTAIMVIALVFVVLYLIRVLGIADVPVPKLHGG